jgi:hypothetical protein
MDVEKVKKLINDRISREKEEIKRQEKLYASSPRYGAPSYSYHEGRIRAFKEVLELVGMIDKPNNK